MSYVSEEECLTANTSNTSLESWELPKSTNTTSTHQAYLVLHQQIENFFVANCQTTTVYLKKMSLRAELFRIFRILFDAIDLYVVGSSLTQLARSDSDVDMCLVFRDRNQVEYDAQAVLSDVKTALAKFSQFSQGTIINAKVPLLKFQDRVRDIYIDLNVNQVVGVRNTHLIASYCRMDTRVAPLIFIVKTWANRNGLNIAYNKTLSSYSWTLMVIHYLQYGCIPPVLPSLQILQGHIFKSDSDITTLNMMHQLPPFRTSNRCNLGQLFVGFFVYYNTEFHFPTSVISVREGKALRKDRMLNYDFKSDYAKQWKYICIEEPFELTNTSHTVFDEKSFNKIASKIRQAGDTIICNPDKLDLVFNLQ